MPRKQNDTSRFVGQKFGRLSILELIGKKKYKDIVKCECECGVIKDYYLCNILKGKAKSCGCLKNEQNHEKRPPKENIIGKVFNRLTVIRYAGYKRGQHSWECLCECGKITTITSCDLKSGHTKSCGCLHTEELIKRCTTHNQSKKGAVSAEYTTWLNMKARCYYESHEYFYNYGGRGIKVCGRWLEGFDNFYADMGKRPSELHTLERKDNDKDYTPDNCVWELMEVQNRNKRTNVFLEYNDERMIISDWTRKLGCGSNFIGYWLKKGKTMDFIINHFNSPLYHGKKAN